MLRLTFTQGRPKTEQYSLTGARLSTRITVVVVTTAVAVLSNVVKVSD